MPRANATPCGRNWEICAADCGFEETKSQFSDLSKPICTRAAEEMPKRLLARTRIGLICMFVFAEG